MTFGEPTNYRIPSTVERRCDGVFVLTVIDTTTPDEREEMREQLDRVSASLGWSAPVYPAATEPDQYPPAFRIAQTLCPY